VGGQIQQTEGESSQVGMIAVDTGTTRVEPLAIHLGEGSLFAGFKRMVRLGAQHIREGTDHLLFLIVLLLPATLMVNGGDWGTFGGSHYSLVRLVRIVTAFTLGHSITLPAGALHWLTLPQRPVEVLIACSILVTSVHAIRPFFPAGRRKSQPDLASSTGSPSRL
jgi:HupE/UreJ protein